MTIQKIHLLKLVRDGTVILKWVRRNSKKGIYLWDKFPDCKLKEQLSEKGFLKFVKNHFNDNDEILAEED